jgi:uncharacterized protein (TIGR02271 family)
MYPNGRKYMEVGVKTKERRNQRNEELSADEPTRIIPVVREEVVAGKQRVETGVTRIRKEVHEREETVDIPLQREEVHIERVPVDRFIEAPLEIRQDGDTTVVPVMEEVMVVEKRLKLKEELHITKVEKTVHEPRKVILRSEEAGVEHEDLPGKESGPGRRKG